MGTGERQCLTGDSGLLLQDQPGSVQAVAETRQIGRDLRAALEGLDNAQLATAHIEAKVALSCRRRCSDLGFQRHR